MTGPRPAGAPADADFGRTLLRLARRAIAQRLSGSTVTDTEVTDRRLAEAAACFVTLTENGRLRGCIGSLEPRRPLAADVRHNALAAAFADPRFAPVRADEWPRLRIEVSLLGPPESLVFADEAAARAQLVPGEDGLIFASAGRRSTFLPQVWSQLPDARQFLARLKEKAGFATDYWAPDVTLARYRVRHWQEAP